MPIVNAIVKWVMVRRMHEIDMFRKFPYQVQRDNFNYLIQTAKNTEWGIKYDYKSIDKDAIDTFRERVPIQNYETLKSDISRILDKNEQNILWPTPIKWFAKSSGTTSDKSKFIPVSTESLEYCHFQGGKDVLSIYYSNYPDSQLFRGKSLALGGSHQINKINSEAFFGDLSAILLENLPFWMQFLRTPDKSIVLIDKFEEKVNKMVEATIKQNVTNLAGVPSWMMILLKRVLEATGKNNILDVWTKLELFVHGGINFSPYREQYKQLIPSDNMHYLETYNASEGFFAIQDDPKSEDLLLMLDYGVFFEFVPLENVGEENPKAYTLEEVQLGKNYAMIISTNGGLWRYMIGDTVKFTSKFPFKVKISGRTKQFINTFGEEVMVDNAEMALKAACEKTGAQIKEYSAGPIYMTAENKGGHQWLIEFNKLPKSITEFAETLDVTLMSLNSDYEAKRKNINPPLITVLQEGTFYKWLKSKNKLGGQHKVPRLSNTREYLDEILNT